MDFALEIVLASSSPRRRALLGQLGIPFRVVAPEVDEIPGEGEAPEAFAVRAAREKAAAVAQTLGDAPPGPLIVAADTIVVLRGCILGKPRDAREARDMLRALSGNHHQVMTGLCVLHAGRPGDGEIDRLVVTDVEMKPLHQVEIEAYVDSGEPMDKAGAYAIQGQGGYMIRAIRGSYTNVVGLPMTELHEILTERFGVKIPARGHGGGRPAGG